MPSVTAGVKRPAPEDDGQIAVGRDDTKKRRVTTVVDDDDDFEIL